MEFNSKKMLHSVSMGTDTLRVLSDGERNRLQKVLVDMLVDIQHICDSVGVEFALCGGSCLGTVRHKGFIPWDDDVDIVMFRKEWDLFKSHFDKFFGDKYVLESPNYGNRDSKYPWSKIYMKGTEYVDVFDINYPFEHGISIDVFVIENVAKSSIVRMFDSICATLFKFVATSMLFYKYPNELVRKMFSLTIKSKFYYVFRRGLGCIFSVIPHKEWLRWYDIFISRHTKESYMVTIPTGTNLYFGEMLPRDVWLPYSKGQFCGYEVNLPHRADMYLRNMYGDDYMKIPPKEKQETHSVVKLTFPEE